VTRIISWKKLMLLAALLAMLIVAAVPAIAQIGQESEQESESGEVDQSFEVSSSGDNSNQCAGIQGVANTGNAQNQVDLIQYGSDADDFEFDEVGSTITVSPENSTTCDQQVNQAASASGDSPGTGGTPVKKKY
jgi:maltose-binding protein MalE